MNDRKKGQQRPDADPKAAPDENRLIAERRAKLAALREAGEAFPNDFRPNATAAGLAERFGGADNEALEAVDEEFAVAGRMMAKRVMGKIAFVRLQDRGGSIQLMLQRDNLPEGVYHQFQRWDVQFVTEQRQQPRPVRGAQQCIPGTERHHGSLIPLYLRYSAHSFSRTSGSGSRIAASRSCLATTSSSLPSGMSGGGGYFAVFCGTPPPAAAPAAAPGRSGDRRRCGAGLHREHGDHDRYGFE